MNLLTKIGSSKEGDKFKEIRFLGDDFTEEKFLGEKVLHKYVDLNYAFRILFEKSLWFSNPVEWPDPFEKLPFAIDWNFAKDGKEKEPFLNGAVFCMCLTNKKVTEAHWKAYSNDQIPVEYRFNRHEFLQQLSEHYSKDYEIYVGKVEYGNIDEISMAIAKALQMNKDLNEGILEWFCKLLLIKRDDFSYEDEIRIILIQKDKIKEPKKGVPVIFKCDIREMVNCVVVGPKTPEFVLQGLQYAFCDPKFGFAPHNGKDIKEGSICASKLYADLKNEEFGEMVKNGFDLLASELKKEGDSIADSFMKGGYPDSLLKLK